MGLTLLLVQVIAQTLFRTINADNRMSSDLLHSEMNHSLKKITKTGKGLSVI